MKITQKGHMSTTTNPDPDPCNSGKAACFFVSGELSGEKEASDNMFDKSATSCPSVTFLLAEDVGDKRQGRQL